MTITREALEAAARAAGYTWVRGFTDAGGWWHSDPDAATMWHPHINHGQLLDLAMACDISIMHDHIGYDISPGVLHFKNYEHGDFNSLAEAVITAAADQQQAKETKE